MFLFDGEEFLKRRLFVDEFYLLLIEDLRFLREILLVIYGSLERDGVKLDY